MAVASKGIVVLPGRKDLRICHWTIFKGASVVSTGVFISMFDFVPNHLYHWVDYHLHLEDFADAFIQSNLQPFIHTTTQQRRSQPRRGPPRHAFRIPVNPLYLQSYCLLYKATYSGFRYRLWGQHYQSETSALVWWISRALRICHWPVVSDHHPEREGLTLVFMFYKPHV